MFSRRNACCVCLHCCRVCVDRRKIILRLGLKREEASIMGILCLKDALIYLSSLVQGLVGAGN